MDRHDVAHYGIAAVLTGAIGAGGVALRNEPRAPVSYALSQSELSSVPFGKHAYIVFAAPNAGDAPYAFVEAIEGAGGSARIEGGLFPRDGIAISPDTPEGHEVGDAISKVTGEAVVYGNDNDGKPLINGMGAFEINVGHPLRKPTR